MKRFSKVTIYIFVSLGLLVLIWWVGSSAYSGWMGYKWEKQTEEFQLALSKPYREDTYGGKTPEETWGMFLDALKKGDVELASKYIVPEKREERLLDFKKAINEERMSEVISKFSSKLEPDDSSNERVSFILSLKNKNGEVEAHLIVFILNPYTKVWKISLL